MMPDVFMQNIDFYLLRPWWLLAILPALELAWLLIRRQHNDSAWIKVIDSELLDALLDRGQQSSRKQWPIFALLISWILSAMAMSGPCFEKNNQAALKQADAVVILLDLSPSMLTQDVQPKRIQAAHYKILDLLQQRREGYTALIAYSGSAHVVAPLSDDANTIAALVNTLEPLIMPSMGSRVEDAVSEALQLLENSHFNHGRLLLITDGVVPEALANIHGQLQDKSVELNVIGIGTATGAPIALPNGGFAKDRYGNILMNPLDENTLKKLAHENKGYYSALRTDDKDIGPLTAPPEWLAKLGADETRTTNHTIENWKDIGYWLAFPGLLFSLIFFRRGVLIGLLPLLLLTHQQTVKADTLPATVLTKTWQDWWATPDQQAARALANGDTASAAKQFVDPQWKAYAEYQNGQHAEAAQHFSQSDSTTAKYNLGNAQARAGDLEGALASYKQALEKKPDFSDAKFNSDLVEQLLKQKQQDAKNGQQQGQDQTQQDKQQNQDPNQQNQEQRGQKQSMSDQGQSQKSQEQQNTPEKQDDNDRQESPEEEKSDSGQEAYKEKENQEENTSDPRKLDDKDQAKENATKDDKGAYDSEKQQATEQWLRKVPDDPGGLLKNKFYYYYQLNRQKALIERRSGLNQEEEEQRW